MASLATPSDMLKRFDTRMLGDLVGDAGVRVGTPDLLTHPNLQAAIDDAWGDVIAALMMSKRYTQEDIDALTAESKQYLIRINCKLALGNLWERREWSDDDQRVSAMGQADKARKELDDLRTGKKVLNLEAAQDAGLPRFTQPAVAAIRQTNLAVDEARRGFYPYRRFSSVSRG